MIERVYVDNFRTFSNFEISFGALNVLLGPNGSGKSNFLDVMRSIRAFVNGDADLRPEEKDPRSRIFETKSITRWDKRREQKFEIDLDDTGQKYRYTLEIEHDINRLRRRIKREQLICFDSPSVSRPLYDAQLDKAQLFRDDGSLGPEVIADWFRSGLGIIQPRGDNTLLTRFKDAVRNIWIASPVPSAMTASAKSEAEVPDHQFSDFASWYSYVSDERQGDVFELTDTLRDGVLQNFDSFRLAKVSDEEKRLQVVFGVGSATGTGNLRVEFSFDELSDGQKILIALYAMHQFALRQGNTFCLDQPENYLALPEIQPWLSKVCEASDEGKCQVMLITHHPELIDLLASNSGYWFDRDDAGPTRVARIAKNGSAGLPLSELIARGWLNA